MALSDHPATRRRSSHADRVLRASPFLLATLPPLYLLAIVLTQTVDVPFADQWALVPLLTRAYEGTFSFQDVWAQHNEHRLLFPRLLMLGLAMVSRWNTHVEMLATIGLAAGVFCLLVYTMRRTSQAMQLEWAWQVPIVSLAVFSLNQAEIWWGGWNIQIALATLAATASIVLLAQPALTRLAFLLALGCGVVASYSYNTGMLVWGVGIVTLALRADRWSARNGLRLGVWALAGALAIALFLSQYHWTAQAPALADVLGHPVRYLTYSVTYLGAAPTRGAVEYLFGAITGDTRAVCNLGDSDLCTYVNDTAIAAGIAGVVLFLWMVWELARRVSIPTILPYLGLGLYALSTGIATSLGRASYGNHQALAQRYAMNATLFWLALAFLLALYAHLHTNRWLARACAGVVVAFALLTLLSTLQGSDHFRWQYEFLAPARDELFRLQNDELLQRLFFDPQIVKQGAAVLRQHQLSVFR